MEVHPVSPQPQHRTGGCWSPITPNLAQGDGGVPGLSFNGACNQKNGGGGGGGEKHNKEEASVSLPGGMVSK